MSAAGAGGPDDEELVGRCFTKARRTPVVVGVVPGGGGQSLRLPGGPYTVTQLGAMVAAVVVLVLSRPVWGHHGWVDLVVMAGVPFGVALALRRVHIDGRNPVAALASVAVMATGCGTGRLHGRAFRPARPRVGRAVVTVGADSTKALPAPAAGAVPSRVQGLLASRNGQEVAL
ncbi:hypothetical protein AB0442_38285 [Kitasatospora sp. NPDC085895]|uniref:hypothetical protein n=1 Tax=Kitasatospora sp. NPDC085895 TaxID=3155057 RepID=UPI00344F7422